MDISIIMPVYNAEKTLKRSIYSALRQEKIEFEIVCIDDGSADTSVEQIKNLQSQYTQIRLLTQSHKGPGLARNIGIENARGRYIAFLDADDELVDAEALFRMVEACSKNHACICGSFRKVFADGKEREKELFKDFQVPDQGCFIEYDDFQHDYDYQSFIFDRDFILENQICFPSYMRYQDPPFLVKAMITAGRFYVLPVTFYRYRLNSEKQDVVITKYISHILQGMRDTLEMARDKGYHKLFENIVRRIDEDFRVPILKSLSRDTMAQLLDIDAESLQFQGKHLEVLTDLYKLRESKDRLAYSYHLMRKIVMIKQHPQGFGPYFENHGIQSAAVYGLGLYGKILLNELKICGIKVVCGIDREVQICGDLPVICPNDTIPECDVLIVSLMEPEAVAKGYEAVGTIRVCVFPQIIEELTALYQFE